MEWTDEHSETSRVSLQNKFVKLVHLVGFITKKFVTMQHGHMNVKLARFIFFVGKLSGTVASKLLSMRAKVRGKLRASL
jgi:hypothetical protein